MEWYKMMQKPCIFLSPGFARHANTKIITFAKMWSPISRTSSILILLLITGAFCLVDENSADKQSECSTILSAEIKAEIQKYTPVVQKIVHAVQNGSFKNKTYNDLEYFVDHYGARIVGSDALEKSIDYVLEEMKRLGFDNVHSEPVKAPKWVRGQEAAVMLAPYRKKISILGLARSEETPPEGIFADAIVVDSFDDLRKNVANATGKIVVFNQPFEDAEKAILYRQLGAIEASKKGAVATLVRSYATFSLGTPHTGLMFYDETGEVPRIPAGEITIEDAEILHRLYKRGKKIRLYLKLSNCFKGEITTRNSIGDLKGTTNPNEFVLISGHIDSWDVGQGALDDGYGVILSIKAIELLKSLQLIPKRTVRTILWTAEEIGKVPLGAQQYVQDHLAELNNYTIFLEADSGVLEAHGLLFNGTSEASCIVGEVLKLLEPEIIKATKMYNYFPKLKTDIVPLMHATNVPGGLIATNADKYFYYHHSEADTMTAIDPKDLDTCLIMWSTLSYVLGDLTHMLPR